MANPSTGSVDWSYEYAEQTIAWEEQCEIRYQKILQLVNAGYVVVPLEPLSKSYLSDIIRKTSGYPFRGPSNPITTVDTVRKWFSKGAPLRDCNYGVMAIRGKLAFLDIDNKGLVSGSAAFTKLCERDGFKVESPYVVRTPNGGYHWYLSHPVETKKAVAFLDSKTPLDWIASENVDPSERVVGPGSVLDTGSYSEELGYNVVALSDIASVQLPEAFVKLLPKRPGNVYPIRRDRPDYVRSGDLGNEDVHEDDQMPKVTLDNLKEALFTIPCEDTSYDQWRNCAMAFHYHFSKTEDAEDAFVAWIEWSKTDADRFHYNDAKSMWNSLDSDTDNPVTAGTVYALAKQYGYKFRDTSERFSALIHEINANTPNVFIGGQSRFILVTKEGTVNIMSKVDAKDWYAGSEEFMNGRMVNPIDLFMRHPGRIKYEGIGMFPPGSTCPPRVYNTWRGYAVDPAPGDVSRYLELFGQMFGHDPETAEWIHDWFASLVQEPGKKQATAVVMRGPQGTGKGMLARVFRDMFLKDNTTEYVHTEQAMSRFNMSLLRSVLVVINEAVWAGNHKHTNILKGYIDGETFEIEDKNVKAFQARNCAHFMISSNEDWTIPVERDGRRFCVSDVPKVRDTHDLWWKKTKDILRKPSTVAAVMHWYMERKITHNLHKVPQNEALREQKRETFTRMNKDDDLMADIALYMLRRGKATSREGAHGGYWITNEEITKCAMLATGTKGTNMFPSRYIKWLKKLFDKTGTYTNHGVFAPKRLKVDGYPASGYVVPDIESVAEVLAAHMFLDKDEIDRKESWEDDAPGDEDAF